MATQQNFRDRWEVENQKRLERLLGLSQEQLQKQALRTAQLASFLLYVNYKGGQWLFKASTVLWNRPQDLDQRLLDAEQHRLKMSCQPTFWLK